MLALSVGVVPKLLDVQTSSRRTAGNIMNVMERTRMSGKCPPSLFRNEPKEESFEAAVAKIIDPTELILSVGGSFGTDFEKVMQMGNSSMGIQGDPETQAAILAQRRCVILAIVGSTPASNSSLTFIMESGFLSSVKSWVDAILSGVVGGVDLLLHLLSNIVALPVTKSNVKDSGMGKAIGSIEKNKICVGTPNEASIKERVTLVKSAWQKSVKLLKEKTNDVEPSSEIASGIMGSIPKHQLQGSSKVDLAPPAKKARTEEKKKSSSLSSLLSKVKPDPDASKKAIDESAGNASTGTKANASVDVKDDPDKKKQKMRVKWHDHFGGELTLSKIIDNDGDEVKPEDTQVDSDASMSDRKRRDRLREKELLSVVKKAKLLDDDDDDGMGMESLSSDVSRAIQPTTAWTAPALLPERQDAPPPQVNSPELAFHTSRMASVARVQYISEHTVPSSPESMTDVEQAVDLTNQSSTVTQSIPFFVPQQVPVPAPAPAVPMMAAAPAYAPPSSNGWMMSSQPPGLPQMQTNTNTASVEFVQSLGLPMFLVGQDTQALQTLAATPSLLSTFVDNNGMYDQARLTSLVHTLSQSSSLGVSPMGQLGGTGYQNSIYAAAPQPAYPGAPPAANTGIYGPASTGIYGPASDSTYGASSWQTAGQSGGFKGKSDDGNLHVSGYGPSTTQADVINLFMPYVKVDEVVMKANFAFVNTSDPPGAARAIDSLTGVLLGGMPIRINPATRRTKTPTSSVPAPFGAAPAPNPASIYGSVGQSIPGLPAQIPPPMMNQGGASFPPPMAPPQAGNIDIENARDDRGNPATKNLFVAGYGQGTTEFQIRELFGQYAQILAIIVKGSFSFVNTHDKAAAIRAREILSGTMLNGGVLRINFAKESGRLGTSFDVTYNGGGRSLPSHYGRR